jgi:hypothetical protein
VAFDEDDLAIHFEANHVEKCDFCKYWSYQKMSVETHMILNHHDHAKKKMRYDFKCPHCPFESSWKVNLKKHSAEAHPLCANCADGLEGVCYMIREAEADQMRAELTRLKPCQEAKADQMKVKLTPWKKCHLIDLYR